MLTKNEKCRIAYKLLLHRRRSRGIRVGTDIIRGINQESQAIGITPEEGVEFAKTVLKDLLEGLTPFGLSIEFESKLTKERRNEIAYLALRKEILHRPMKLSEDIRREVTKNAMAIDEDPDMIMDIMQEILQERIDAMFQYTPGCHRP
jgi:hypothetical protein